MEHLRPCCVVTVHGVLNANWVAQDYTHTSTLSHGQCRSSEKYAYNWDKRTNVYSLQFVTFTNPTGMHFTSWKTNRPVVTNWADLKWKNFGDLNQRIIKRIRKRLPYVSGARNEGGEAKMRGNCKVVGSLISGLKTKDLFLEKVSLGTHDNVFITHEVGDTLTICMLQAGLHPRPFSAPDLPALYLSGRRLEENMLGDLTGSNGKH